MKSPNIWIRGPSSAEVHYRGVVQHPSRPYRHSAINSLDFKKTLPGNSSFIPERVFLQNLIIENTPPVVHPCITGPKSLNEKWKCRNAWLVIKFLYAITFQNLSVWQHSFDLGHAGGFGSYLFGMSEVIAKQSTEANDAQNIKNPGLGWMIAFLFIVSFLGLFSVVPLRKVIFVNS